MSFPLYKKRDFGEYISDTFQFLKRYWKNFFKNYIVINGALLLLLCAIFYFFFKDLFADVMADPTAMPSLFMGENSGLFIFLIVAALVVTLIFTLFSTAYPIVYMRLVASTDREDFTAGEIFNEIRSNLGRLLLFTLWSLLIFAPIVIVFSLLSFALIFILIGLPLLIIGLGAIMIWMSQTLYVYLNDDCDFFEALKSGWRILFGNFMHIVGSGVVVYMIISTLSGILSFIPMMIMISRNLTSGSVANTGTMSSWMVAIYVVQIVLSYLLTNIFYINQGLVYYGSKEEKENIQAFSEIDSIGNNEE